MKSSFSLADIIDIEFLLTRDEQQLEQGDDTELRRRDRAIFIAGSLDPGNAPETRTLVGHWLAARRQEYQQEQRLLPGQIWQETSSLGALLLCLCSFLIGAALAASLLRYDGTTPVNVSGFFALFILVQLLLLALNLGLISYRLLGRVKSPNSIVYSLLTRALTRLFTSLFKRSQKHLPAARRLDLQAATGSLQQLQQRYGNLLLWPPFILLQLGGSAFNLGVLLTLLAKISFTDIAFGWQSTLPLSDAVLAELVRWIALPWSWILPQTWAYPGLDQIIGSKIILIEGNWRLTQAGLTSWWPFLLCGILTYGLLPRLLLLAWGRYQLTSRLNKLPCDHAAFSHLRRRMLTPIVATEAQGQIPPPAAPQAAVPASFTPTLALTGTGYLLVIPDELWDSCPVAHVAPYLAELDRSGPLPAIRYGAIEESMSDFFAQLRIKLKEQDLAGIIVLQEAWQPPIREVLNLLTELRRLIGRAPLGLALIGKPTPATPLTPVQGQDLSVWIKTTKGLADPYLDVFPLVRN